MLSPAVAVCVILTYRYTSMEVWHKCGCVCGSSWAFCRCSTSCRWMVRPRSLLGMCGLQSSTPSLGCITSTT